MNDPSLEPILKASIAYVQLKGEIDRLRGEMNKIVEEFKATVHENTILREDIRLLELRLQRAAKPKLELVGKVGP